MFQENIVSDLVFKQLQLETENQSCADCGKNSPQCASVSNGVFICMDCAAIHRDIGMRVKSLPTDTWSEKQLRLMALGGNKKQNHIISNYGLNEESVQMKYNSRAC